MYGDARDDELRGVTTICSRGRLFFSVVHDVTNECVVVNVLRAYGLMASVTTGNSSRRLSITKSKRPGRLDTSVRVFLVGETSQGQTTKVIRDSNEPVYEQSFCFHLGRHEVAEEVLIKLWVQEHDRFSRRSDIGLVTFQLRDLDDQAAPGDVMEIWRDIVLEKQVSLQGASF